MPWRCLWIGESPRPRHAEIVDDFASFLEIYTLDFASNYEQHTAVLSELYKKYEIVKLPIGAESLNSRQFGEK